MTRRLRRKSVAWLGLLALLIQALLPLAVGAEVAAIARSGDHELLEFCAFGHLHVAGDNDTDGRPDHHHHSDRLCPICVALQASPAFTAPAPAVLPLPSAAPIRIATRVATVAPRFVAFTAYRSRAPPSADLC
jgi:hypothetical protein